jgi:hypothetical protein
MREGGASAARVREYTAVSESSQRRYLAKAHQGASLELAVRDHRGVDNPRAKVHR